MDSELKRMIIIENYEKPFHKIEKENTDYIKLKAKNASCIDDLNIYINYLDNKIENILFSGQACVISTSATSLLIKNLIGKTKKEALEILSQYDNMINERKYNEDILNELNVYNEIYKQSNRKSCALLPSNAIKNYLEKLDD